MVKQLQKLLFLAAMLFVPWVTQAQTLEDYSFLTGVDTTKWIDMSSATQILTPANSDGMASTVDSLSPLEATPTHSIPSTQTATFAWVQQQPAPLITRHRSLLPTATKTIRRSTHLVATVMEFRQHTMSKH